jgi:predicted RNA-binding Zn-ribbon protein involved in translation (DUF1610 family)
MEQHAKIICPKCQGEMQPGVAQTFVGDYWFEALFDDKGKFSLSRKSRRRVYTYRCVSCGYLERYAY